MCMYVLYGRMKVRKDITIEYDTLRKYQKLISKDPKLLGNFSGGIEQLIEREIREKNLQALEQPRLAIFAEFAMQRQSLITEYDIKLLQHPEERMTNLKALDSKQLTKVASDVLFLKTQIEYARKKK
jgi:hypothetical protein